MEQNEIIRTTLLNFDFPLDILQEGVKTIESYWNSESEIYFKDGQLTMDIQGHRGVDFLGTPSLDPEEVGILMKAFRSPQYKRFILHLLHSYTDPSKIHPLDGDSSCNCSICGNTLFQYRKWTCNDIQLALASTESQLPICKNCLMQLNYTKEILKNLGQIDYQINN